MSMDNRILLCSYGQSTADFFVLALKKKKKYHNE